MKEKSSLKERGCDTAYASYCDHTVLRAYTTREKVKEFCEEAVKYGAASVCVNPVHVSFVHHILKGSSVKVSTVIGFPLGANKTVIKAMEAKEAVADGADEVDMVINIGAMRDGQWDVVEEDMKAVVSAVQKKAIVKVIIETCYLTKEEMKKACELAMEAGADYIKTSTGMGSGGARVEDILWIREIVGDKMKIKASGSISNRDTARAMLVAGADRLGVSRVPQIVQDEDQIASAAATNPAPCFP